MSTHEKLLGFDAREAWQQWGDAWDAERVQMYLLRKDLKKPLSIDTAVWPSAFEFEDYQWPTPSWVGDNTPWWSDLAELREAVLGARPLAPRPVHLIGITRVCETGPVAPHPAEAKGESCSVFRWPNLDVVCTPGVRQADWRLLGFDVSDGSYSGLSNCGYTGDDRAIALPRWTSQLNEYHLFDRAEDADEFRRYSDERVHEHAPFSVFGLWSIEVI